jgi:hypothetical protein
MLDAPDIRIRYLTAIGTPPLEILNVARRENVDLIVMGIDSKWHLESTKVFQRFLLNSTVAKVVQDARCPVWLDNSPSASTMKISNLVCYLDLKLNCERLIQFASRIAEECETQMLLFHSTVSARIFAPGQPRNVVELQRYHIQMAESAIDQLQTRCSTSAAKIVAAGDGVAALCKTLKEFSSPLIVLERVSDRWGDNHKIFEIIRSQPWLMKSRADVRPPIIRRPTYLSPWPIMIPSPARRPTNRFRCGRAAPTHELLAAWRPRQRV